MRARHLAALAMLAVPLAGRASELDDIKGWRATRTVAVAAAPSVVAARVSDPEAWPAWTSWSRGECTGPAGAVGRTCVWTGVDETVTYVVTAVDAGSVHYDYRFGAAKGVNKGILSWAASDQGTSVTWDAAGTKKSVPKDMKKTAAADTGKELESALTRLKAVAEADSQRAADLVVARKKLADLDAAATAAEAEAATAATAATAAKAQADAAVAAVAAAKKPKEKAALQMAADAAARAAADATAAADTAKVHALAVRKDADDARDAAAKLASP